MKMRLVEESNDREKSLSPYGLLVSRLGHVKGREVFDALERLSRVAADQHGGVPAIVFDVDGGRFVSIIEKD